MPREMRNRKRLFVVLVALLEWQLVFSALIAIAYDEINNAAAPLLVGAVVLIGVAVVVWSEVVASKPIPGVRASQRIRIGLYAAYPLLLGVGIVLALPLGIRYFVLANPLAATLFKAASVGSLGILVLLAVAILSWQRSLKHLEKEPGEPSDAPPASARTDARMQGPPRRSR